jgi:DNA-binding NtrC family response regulator
MTSKRMLIVDDEPDFMVVVRRVAERLGFEVECVTHGRDFKQAYARFDPTVVILDMVMPEVDGIELIEWLAGVGAKAQIIIISGFTPIYAKTAVTLGEAKGLLSISRLAKPVSLAALTGILTEALAVNSDAEPSRDFVSTPHRHS